MAPLVGKLHGSGLLRLSEHERPPFQKCYFTSSCRRIR